MAAKLTTLTHKIVIHLRLVPESCTICNSRSRRPVLELLDTPSYFLYAKIAVWWLALPRFLKRVPGSYLGQTFPVMSLRLQENRGVSSSYGIWPIIIQSTFHFKLRNLCIQLSKMSLNKQTPFFRTKSPDSSVGIATSYGLDDQMNGVRFPAGAGNFSLRHRVQTGSGAHPASHPMRTGGSFTGGKAARA
jgi:hypothetical protein